MLKPFGNYISGNTLLHRLDPRAKLICTAMIFSSVLVIGMWIGLIPVAVLIIIIWLITQHSITQIAKDVVSLSFLYIVTIVLHSMLTPGDPLFKLAFGFKISAQGLEKGIFFSFKIICLAVLAGFILRTTHQAEWAKAVEGLLPRKGVFGRFAFTLGLTFRFFPMILGEANRIRQAQIGRGLESDGGLIKRIKNLVPVVLPMLSATFRKADIITFNLQARGFRIEAARSCYKPLRLTFEDIAAGILTAATVILSFFLLSNSG